MLASWEDTRAEQIPGKAGIQPAELEREANRARVQQQLFGDDAAGAPPTLGRFQLIRRIGSGAMGVVFEGYDPALGRRLALKVLRSDVAAQQSLMARSRMLREAQALARVRHPNVTMIYEVGTSDEGHPFIAMELVEGRTLKGWLRSRPRSCREIVDVFLQAGRGLAAAHEAGVVHRDFKPDNVLVDERGQARVVDFGLARSAGMAELLPTLDDSDGDPVPLHLTCTGAILGTPAYMAPEQFQGGPPRASSDQFSFCVALFEALHGRRPYPGNDLPSLQRSLVDGKVVGRRRGVPRRLHRVLRRGLSIDPRGRYPSMGALLDALEACQPRPRLRRSAVLVAGLAAAALAGSLLPMRSSEPGPAATCTAAAASTSPSAAISVVARAW
ncbi:MAG: serine/threonine protein kinase [Myxococcales bacterium]|nr:serine/threonine protein kinase [Myxococcales bacterium]